jgi:hypothetical protein
MTELTVGENLLVDPKQRISFPIIRTERTGRRACNTGLLVKRQHRLLLFRFRQ